MRGRGPTRCAHVTHLLRQFCTLSLDVKSGLSFLPPSSLSHFSSCPSCSASVALFTIQSACEVLVSGRLYPSVRVTQGYRHPGWHMRGQGTLRDDYNYIFTLSDARVSLKRDILHVVFNYNGR